MKTLEEILSEVMKIINSSNDVETRLQHLEENGFTIEFNWVKNGEIGTVYFMKRQQVYRIQVAPSEKCGNYHKAFCIIIPIKSVSQQLTELIKVRNMSVSKKPDIVFKANMKINNMSKNKF